MKFYRLSTQAKASIAYMISSILTKGINFITLPIFTRLLTTKDMGVVTTFNSWFSILYAMVTLSMTAGSFNIAMMEYKDQRDKYEAVCLTLSTISSSFFALIYILLSTGINKMTMLSAPLMGIQILLFYVNPALDMWFARQRYEYNYKPVVVVSLVITVVSTAVAIIVIYVSKKFCHFTNLGEIRILTQNGIIVFFGIFFYFKIYRKCHVAFDYKMAHFALMLSIPLIIHTLAKNILDASDRIMIGKICGEEAAGKYGTVYSISLIALIVWNAINSALIPTIFEELDSGNFKLIEKISMKVILLFSGVSMMVTVIAPEIVHLLTTRDYYEAVYIIPAITAGVFMTSIYGIYGDILLYKKKSTKIMIATMVAAATNLILNFIFVRIYGYIAASYTTLFSFVILAFMQGIMCKVEFKQSILRKDKLIAVSLFTIGFCLLCNIAYWNTGLRLILGCGLVLAFIMKRNQILKILLRKDFKND